MSKSVESRISLSFLVKSNTWIFNFREPLNQSVTGCAFQYSQVINTVCTSSHLYINYFPNPNKMCLFSLTYIIFYFGSRMRSPRQYSPLSTVHICNPGCNIEPKEQPAGRLCNLLMKGCYN